MDFIISTHHVPTEISLWFQCEFNYAFLPFIPLEPRICWAAVETVYTAFSPWTTSPWCKFVTIERRAAEEYLDFTCLFDFVFLLLEFLTKLPSIYVVFLYFVRCTAVSTNHLNIIIYFLSVFRRLHVEIRSARVSSSPSLGFLCILHSFMSSSETESWVKNKIRTFSKCAAYTLAVVCNDAACIDFV